METKHGSEKWRSSAMKFVLLMAAVSLFSDMTYEAAPSLNGPYLALFGASNLKVGLTAGLGELYGYGLRVLSRPQLPTWFRRTAGVPVMASPGLWAAHSWVFSMAYRLPP